MSDSHDKNNVIRLPLERRRVSKKEAKMLVLSDEIDAIINKYIADAGLDLKTLAGLVAHRLGTFIGRVDQKHELFRLCVKIIKDCAKL